MNMPDWFIGELRKVFDKSSVLTDTDIEPRYYHDLAGQPVDKPRAVVRPRTTEQVSAFLRLCHRERVPVATQGGMTGLVRGALPNSSEIVLSMERMNAVEEVDTLAGTAVAQAGAPLQKIHERVEQEGYMFPIDLGARGSCTIGGNVSTNAGGNRVIRYGMTRDLILGLEVVTADGIVLQGLRKHIKNNTGIDLKQLFIGSEGILGVVTRAALRIFPAPAERQVALCALPSFPQVTSFLRMARKHLGGELTAFELMWNEYYRLTVERVKGVIGPLPTRYPFYVLVEASGDHADRIHADQEKLLEAAIVENLIVDATLSNTNASAEAMWRIRDSSGELARTFPYAARISFDVSLAIDRMDEYTRSIGASIKTIDTSAFLIVFGHVGDGNLHLDVHHENTPTKGEDLERLVYQITGDFDGSISAEHGIGILKRPYLKISRTQEEIETMRMLKRALDPNRILNPGRIFTM
ncbi:FAD-binding oxidoreductase [Bradyrhizobium sp. 183]|uniref:FAD-binding oxidoreductase n=1 Tax=unclassified Bradyrhizobium TaxID=2631580 RepID=UPI001FFF2C82|nr:MULTISPECIES: FAD-binding oxidoreductase [unclassified Bradyrhizobium]UPJ79406.1 FAD-binding oxidoreductase [Bradyrhizobium sp. 184]UPJ87202.1 FAD-binding oxidoreductase [Bradyrhizobium sp. 183]